MKPMLLRLAYLRSFFAGAVYEFSSVWWVHSATHDKMLLTGLVSAIQAAALVSGVTDVARSWQAGVPFVLGYAIGSSVAVLSLSAG